MGNCCQSSKDAAPVEVTAASSVQAELPVAAKAEEPPPDPEVKEPQKEPEEPEEEIDKKEKAKEEPEEKPKANGEFSCVFQDDTKEAKKHTISFTARPLGFNFGNQDGYSPVVVKNVVHGSLADELGVKEKWRLLEIAGREILSFAVENDPLAKQLIGESMERTKKSDLNCDEIVKIQYISALETKAQCKPGHLDEFGFESLRRFAKAQIAGLPHVGQARLTVMQNKTEELERAKREKLAEQKKKDDAKFAEYQKAKSEYSVNMAGMPGQEEEVDMEGWTDKQVKEHMEKLGTKAEALKESFKFLEDDLVIPEKMT